MRSTSFLPPAALLAAILAAVPACTSPADDDAAAHAAPSAAPAAVPAARPSGPPGTGKVLETMNSGGYSYVRVDLGGGEVWAAGPETTVKVGDTVKLSEGMAMRDFHSSTLDRTFPVVWFVGSIETGAGADALAAAHKSVAPSAAPVAPVARLDGGQTVEEIVTKRAELAGKDVAVRGRVVKFNAGIMGSNWIHIQDGSGSAGTNDLTVTTDATVAIGDEVVVRGKVAIDRDFGGGYKYAVIVERAVVGK
jgi:hypothetical protein